MAFVTIAIFYFAGMFAFAFGTACLVPLILAMREPPSRSWFSRIPLSWRFVPDLVLMGRGFPPLILLTQLTLQLARGWPSALAKWRGDPALRGHFRIFAGCSALAAALAAVPV